MQIDYSALAHYVEATLDYSPDYEDDEFAFTFAGVRCYCERYRTHFRIEVGHEDDVVELPRC